MAGINFPSLPIRGADDYSRFLSRGLLLAYLMHEGTGDTVKNYGSWGAAANLTPANVSWTRRGSGLYGLHFNNNLAVVSNTTLSKQIPEEWSYAVWVQSDIAQSGVRDIFSFHDSGLPQVRAHTDVVGVWSWQKRSIADTYTVLPPEDYPDDGVRLIVSVFNGIGIPPVQLRTERNLGGLPRKPDNYQTFNSGQGLQSNIASSIFLGNNEGLTAPWKGTIGPFYFWDRALSEEEVWALKQDPYAPFRRDTAQILVPAALISQMSTQFHPTDDPGSGITLSSDNDLFIFIKDDFQYLNAPADVMVAQDTPVLNLFATETYTYLATPTDEASSLTIANPVIEINEGYTYLAAPTDEASSQYVAIPVIEVSEGYTYVASPADQVVFYDAQVPVGISIDDEYTYPDVPTESTGHTLT